MNGVNLIPAGRILARRRAARVRLWASVVPAVVSALVGAYGWLRTTWPTESGTLQARITELDSAISATEAGTAAVRRKIVEQEVQLRAARAVGEQPDWGVLLHRLSAQLGESIVYTGCVLEPVVPTGAENAKPGGRPERFTLTLHGMGKGQADVSAFVIALEREGEPRLFDSVALMESRRVPLNGKDAVAFRIECHLSDSAEVRP